jgi:hypothetical protein
VCKMWCAESVCVFACERAQEWHSAGLTQVLAKIMGKEVKLSH